MTPPGDPLSTRPRRLEGRNCLIVGGTSGIGLAAARRFLQEGARVFVAGLELIRNAGVIDELGALGPFQQVDSDVRDESTVVRLFEQAMAFFGGRIDVLFHVAGMSGRRFGDGALHECTNDAWDRVLQANAGCVFLTNRQAVRIMLGQQERDGFGLRGTIVNLGSALSHSPSPEHFGTAAYIASKGAVRSLTLASAARYAKDGIRFNLIEPGLIDTPMAARAAGDPTILAYLKSKQPMTGGPGSAEDVAEAALYLCEPASRFVTGVVLSVDGGWSISEGPAAGADQR